MFIRSVETTWGNLPQCTLLDKMVFPYAIPNWDRDTEIANLLGDRPVHRVQDDENFYKNEDFRANHK